MTISVDTSPVSIHRSGKHFKTSPDLCSHAELEKHSRDSWKYDTVSLKRQMYFILKNDLLIFDFKTSEAVSHQGRFASPVSEHRPRSVDSDS